MPPVVFGLVAVAAVIHAAWNVIVKTSGDPLRTSARAMAGGVALGLPFAVAAWLATGAPAVPAAAIGLAVLSGCIETAYFILLSTAYRHGDLSVVYPIARGTAPLLAVAVGVIVLGDRLSPTGALGVAALAGGILIVQRPWRALRRGGSRGRAGAVHIGGSVGRVGPLDPDGSVGSVDADGSVGRVGSPVGPGGSDRPVGRRTGFDRAVLYALATGVAIAAYSAVDSVGVKLVDPWVFAAIAFPVDAVTLVLWVRYVDRAPVVDGRPASDGAPWGRATLAGALSLVGYLLILGAYSVAPLTVIAPLREAAVVLGSAWGSFRLGEAASRGEGWRRIMGAAFVLAGAVLVAIGA